MILLAANLEAISTLKDGTIKLVFETQEITPAKAGELFSLRNKLGFLCFKEEQFTDNEMEIITKLKADDFEGNKTPSQRMRNVLYRLWEQSNEGYTDFNLFYQFRMNQLIEKLKSRLG